MYLSSNLLKVLQRIDDVSLMCDKRVVSLKKLTLKPPRPVQQVIPEPAVPLLQPLGGAPHLLRTRRNQNRRVSTENILIIFFFVTNIFDQKIVYIYLY